MNSRIISFVRKLLSKKYKNLNSDASHPIIQNTINARADQRADNSPNEPEIEAKSIELEPIKVSPCVEVTEKPTKRSFKSKLTIQRVGNSSKDVTTLYLKSHLKSVTGCEPISKPGASLKELQ